MAEPVVQLRGVSKSYGWFKALSDVSFQLAEGEVFGYIGPNGAGKTTTLKILAGLIRTFDGEVTIAGRPARGRRAELHDLIGFLPQSVGFQSWRTADSALESLGLLSGVSRDELRPRIDELLERFELAAFRSQKIRTLSGGMTQKLGLIQALLHRPRLLILDEPLSGLDPLSRNLVKEVVRERRDAGTTVIFSSHILGDLQDIADRVGILFGGRLIEVGTMAELKASFGMPVDVELELAELPESLEFLDAPALIERATERRRGSWLLRLALDADLDEAIHHLVTSTLEGGGRIRRVGSVEPNLDDVYARFIARAAMEMRRAA